MEDLLKLRRYLKDQLQLASLSLYANQQSLKQAKDPKKQRSLKRKRKRLRLAYKEISQNLLALQNFLINTESVLPPVNDKTSGVRSWKWLGVINRG